MRTKEKRITTKIVAFVLAFVFALGTAFAAPAENVEAAVTAKSLVKSALKYMESYDLISYTYDLSWNVDGTINNRTGKKASDSKTTHAFLPDSSESQGGWEEYDIENTMYYRSYGSSSWSVSDYYTSASEKEYLEDILGSLKNMKITSRGKKTYTVTAKMDSSSKIKKVTLVINKEKKCITKMKVTSKKYTSTLNTTDTHTVKNQVITWSNITYGKGSIQLPSGL